MSHTSPASFLIWALMTSFLGCFLVFHLWSFDRFQCLRWNTGPNSGAFKRVMTYSYLLAVPMVMIYSIGFAVIKYREGFIYVPPRGVIPKPYFLWSPSASKAIFPLTLIFSMAWSLEMVTHLEELCFWLFLVNASSGQQDWFRSLYFRTWVLGSIVAIIYMPFVTIFTRRNILMCEAYTFLAGSLGSLSLTLWFTPVLWTFPAFLENLRREGVDTATVVRLTKFAELNNIRVFCRFLMVIPLLLLGIDGVQPHHHVNESMFWTDFLAMVAVIGLVVSSGITLVIFFPRSIEGEIAAKDSARERRKTSTLNGRRSISIADTTFTHSLSGTGTAGHGTYLLTSSPVKQNFSDTGVIVGNEDLPQLVPNRRRPDTAELSPPPPPPPAPELRHPRSKRKRGGVDVEMNDVRALTDHNLSQHNSRTTSNLNPMIHHFTSPINLAYYSAEEYKNAHASRQEPV